MPNVFAFLSYVVVTTFTPGPNNVMSMSNASRYGFRRSMRFTTGVCAGFFLPGNRGLEYDQNSARNGV